MRSPLPFPCVPDRPYKILLVQVGTLSFSHPSFGVSVLFIYYWERLKAMTQALTDHAKAVIKEAQDKLRVKKEGDKGGQIGEADEEGEGPTSESCCELGCFVLGWVVVGLGCSA